MDARVEAYVDGDLPPPERATFEQVLDESPHWQAQVRHARRIRDELHTFATPSCPPQVTDAVLTETRRRANGASSTDASMGWWTWLWRELDIELQAGWKPALAFATLLLIIVTSSLLTDPQQSAGLVQQQSGGAQHYTSAEIQQAETKAKWAIAYIAQVSQKTGSTVEETVLEENVARPMRRALRPFAKDDIPPNNPNQ